MKRQHHEEHANHEAWAIPYADLLTLLLALFVVMYAVSVVNTGKYKVMSESMYEAFNGTPRSIVMIAPPKDQGHDNSQQIPTLNLPRPMDTAPPITPLKVNRVNPINMSPYNSLYPIPLHSLTDIAEKVRRSVQPLIDKKLIIVRKVQNWLEIEIRSDILYPSGRASLSPTADSTLTKLAQVLSGFDNALRIEGYTDNMPIDTSIYPSNWELSAARSASVARLFAANGVSPERMSILGWGEYHPNADNATAAGRNLNRRVVIVVLSDPGTRTSNLQNALAGDEASPQAPPAAPSGPVVQTRKDLRPAGRQAADGTLGTRSDAHSRNERGARQGPSTAVATPSATSQSAKAETTIRIKATLQMPAAATTGVNQ